MNQELKTVLWILLTLLLAWITYIFVQHYAPYEESVEVGFQGIAKVNPYLAVQRYWEKQGHKVTFSRQFSHLKNNADTSTLFLPIEAIPEEPKAFASLERFIREGGTLVTGFASNSPQQDRWPKNIYFLIGLESIKHAAHKSDKILKETSTTGQHELKVKTHFPVQLVPAYLSKVRLEVDNQPWWISRKNQRGGGVHLFVDLSIFENNHIGEFEHASVLNDLSFLLPPGKIILYVNGQHVGLWTIIWRHAPISIILFVVLLIIILSSHSKCFGPPLQEQFKRPQPSLLAHLKAAALLLPKTDHIPPSTKPLIRLKSNGKSTKS